MRHIETRHYIRISKAEAREWVARGLGGNIYALPCKLHPENMWLQPEPILNEDFEEFTNNFQLYNCNSETGRYLSYYRRK